MARNLTEKEKQNIIDLYLSGCSYKEVQAKTGAANSTIASLVKSKRSLSDSAKLSFARNGRKITDEGRKKMSDAGKKACQSNGKYWTKPEQDFCKLLRANGTGVIFPFCIAKVIGENSDSDAYSHHVYFQYPIQRYVCDFVDILNKVVYRIQGDFWHANPLLYKEKLTAIQKHNVRQDANSRVFLEKHGWQVVDVWESELKWNVEAVKKRIQAVSSEARAIGLHPIGRDFEILTAYEDWSDRLNELWFKKPKLRETINKVCKCGITFEVSSHNKKLADQKFCSPKCAALNIRKVNRPTKEWLEEDLKTMSICAIGRKYGVSDNAIRKWLK